MIQNNSQNMCKFLRLCVEWSENELASNNCVVSYFLSSTSESFVHQMFCKYLFYLLLLCVWFAIWTIFIVRLCIINGVQHKQEYSFQTDWRGCHNTNPKDSKKEVSIVTWHKLCASFSFVFGCWLAFIYYSSILSPQNVSMSIHSSFSASSIELITMRTTFMLHSGKMFICSVGQTFLNEGNW